MAVVVAAAGFGIVAAAVPASAATVFPSTQSVSVQPTSGSVSPVGPNADWWW